LEETVVSSAAVTICFCVLFVFCLLLLAILYIITGDMAGLMVRVKRLENPPTKPSLPEVGDVHPFTPDAKMSRRDVENFGGEMWTGRPSGFAGMSGDYFP
jgi:hypothetical protein